MAAVRPSIDRPGPMPTCLVAPPSAGALCAADGRSLPACRRCPSIPSPS